MKRFRVSVLYLCAAAAFVSSCAFLPRKDRIALAEYEKPQYVMQRDIVINPESGIYLRKGDLVVLKVKTGTDWVKVWGYNASIDPLQAPPVLMLYLFSTDFENEKFSMPVFDAMLSQAVKKKEESPAPSPSKKDKR